MGIGKEFMDTLNAKLLAIIRNLQDPRQQVELSIKQLQDLLNQSMSAAAEVGGQAGLMRAKAAQEQHEADDFANSARLAVQRAKRERDSGNVEEAQGYENAARQALTLQMQNQDIADQYAQQASALEDQARQMSEQIAKIRLLITKLQARKQAVIATELQAEATRKIGQTQQGIQTLDDILDTFQRMEDKATLNLKTEQARVRLAQDPMRERLDQLNTDARVDEAFARLQASAGENSTGTNQLPPRSVGEK